MFGDDAETPPTLDGFDATGRVLWVYDSGGCSDSVPLLSAVSASATDHYYTTDPDEHAELLSCGCGWVDDGMVAHVLPM